MNHLHFETIPSTHVFLKENIDNLIKNDNEILISCDEQTNGVGRTGNVWLQNQNSLAFSFTIAPNLNLTLTPIELGLIILKYFNEKYNADLKLKWPNDIMDAEGKKIGGIITNFYNPNNLIGGIGINIGELKISLKHARYQIGSLALENHLPLKEWSAEIYRYILENRIPVDECLNEYKKVCIHFMKVVTIVDNAQEETGIFLGCTKDGAAIIKTNEATKEFISGSLTVHS